MDTDSYIITFCPSCECRYRAPGELIGRKISCKKCGTGFRIYLPDETTQAKDRRNESSKQGDDIPDSEEQVEIDAEFDLNVSKDNLNAFISIKKEITDPMTVDHIKIFLQMKGIQYGIVDEAQIAEYLKITGNKEQTLKIAEGSPPEPGKDAHIKFYFETDPLKVGAIKEGGSIDFKDRGDILLVKEGDLLVEKIPFVEGKPGKDVYGNPIPSQKPNDIKLKHGKGTKVSEDRLKIMAKIDGIPEISAMGRVYVSPQLKISGDIGLETGHVDFDGKIEVSETIQNGFRVRGNSLIAKEILKAEIDMSGDIVVYGGIIGATIKTGGNLRAMYIHESRIDAYGDVVVEKELIDCRIDTSGACIVNKGPILSSTVGARKGIRAISIGSEISKPCSLMVGEDERIKHEIDRLKEAVLLKKQYHKKLKNRLEEIKDQPKNIERQIAEMAQVQDKRMVAKRNIEDQIQELKDAGNQTRMEDAEAELKTLFSEMKKGEEKLDSLFNKQEQIAGEIPDIQKKITDTKAEIKKMKFKLSEIVQWSAREKGIPEVRVKDMIFADTTINGFYSSLKLKQDYKCVLIKEYIKQRVKDGSQLNTNPERSGSKISVRPLV
ncbi:MAG: FapA family protein [Desulfobacterales bacterium]|jgi:hypothetical protein